MYLWGFVCWDICCKSQYGWRYYELMLRNQWDLGIYLNMALVKVEQGHFETAILILHNFFVFYYGYRCLEALHKISSWFKRCEQWCSCLRVHILVWMLLQDFCDRFGYREPYNARIYELCFTRFKVEYKRSYIFKALPVKQESIFRYGL